MQTLPERGQCSTAILAVHLKMVRRIYESKIFTKRKYKLTDLKTNQR
jgi:hypothetical protein